MVCMSSVIFWFWLIKNAYSFSWSVSLFSERLPEVADSPFLSSVSSCTLSIMTMPLIPSSVYLSSGSLLNSGTYPWFSEKSSFDGVCFRLIIIPLLFSEAEVLLLLRGDGDFFFGLPFLPGEFVENGVSIVCLRLLLLVSFIRFAYLEARDFG